MKKRTDINVTGLKILNHLETKHTGEKKLYISTLANGIRNQKESKKKAILDELVQHSGEFK